MSEESTTNFFSELVEKEEDKELITKILDNKGKEDILKEKLGIENDKI